MIAILTYWKQISVTLIVVVLVSLFWTISVKNATIQDLQDTIIVKEAEIAVSNNSIYTLQNEIEKYNQRMNIFIQTQQLKQKETEQQLQKLLIEKASLQVQMEDILSTPETGDECTDITSLLDNVGTK